MKKLIRVGIIVMNVIYSGSLLADQNKDLDEELKVELKSLKAENRTLRSSIKTIQAIEKLKDKNEELALELKCTKDEDPEACNQIGVHYYRKKKRQRALVFWERACEKFQMDSCYYLGRHYDGHKQKKNAIQYYSKACDGDSFVACNNLGVIYGKDKKLDFAKKYFRDACENRYAGSCVNLAKIFQSKSNRVEAYYWYKKACDLEVVGACEKNKKTISEGRKACLKEKHQSCIALGNIFKRINDLPKAKDAYQRSCEKGQMIGCFNLGLITYELGEKGSTIRFWKRACELKDQYSCLLYLSYEQNKKLLSKYTDYFDKLCESGDGVHCYWMAVSYSIKGETDEAMKYLNRATILDFNDWAIPETNTLLKNLRALEPYKTLKLRTRQKNA